MTKEKIEAVKVEMKRLAARINELEAKQKAEANEKYPSLNPRQTGAVRRASMDLTRALSDLRR